MWPIKKKVSTMKLVNNSKINWGKRNRHFDINMLYVTDLMSRNEVSVKYCPTGNMIVDFMTKPLTRSKFKYFRDFIKEDGESIVDEKFYRKLRI